MERLQLSVSEFISLTNQTLDAAYPSVEVVGEISGFKVNQGKFVFFDLKDEEASVGCFMMLFQLRTELEDGMKISVIAQPKLTNWGKFSLTVRSIQLVGEGSLKRSFELLKAKLEKEGLFREERKRLLPELPSRIGVISSVDAAGYGDFIKILGERWGGLEVDVAHTQVQGAVAPEQIIRALQYFNETSDPIEVVLIIRGGGSADDLAVFNDEPLVRAIASSRIPVMTGIGHEVDITLADLAADKRASTPSNAAQILVPDKKEFIESQFYKVKKSALQIEHIFDSRLQRLNADMQKISHLTERRFEELHNNLQSILRSLKQVDPRVVLRRGYSLVKIEGGAKLGEAKKGDILNIETSESIIKGEVISNDKK